MKIAYKILFFMLALSLPVIANAETVISTNKTVNVYAFIGNGCSHCAEMKTYLASIKDTYNLNITYYETWYNADNLKIMKRVEAYYNIDTANSGSVPLLTIGNRKFQGYASYFNSEILAAITSYTGDDAAYVAILDGAVTGENNTSNYITIGVAIVLVVGLYFFVKPPKKEKR